MLNSKHDIVVNSYTILQVMGQLSIESLGVGVARYDVEPHYNETNGKWWSTKVSREKGYVGVTKGAKAKSNSIVGAATELLRGMQE